MNRDSIDFMTARQLQELLQVDRTTVYRMAERGRVPALKVGGQWRFPRRQIEVWLQSATESQSGNTNPSIPATALGQSTALELTRALPLECVQLIQDTFAHVLGVSLVITDLEGQPVTRPSNLCGLYRVAMEQGMQAREEQRRVYAELAGQSGIRPRYTPGFLGLLCARGVVPLGQEMVAMVIAEGIAPAEWPPQPEKVEAMAQQLDMEPATLTAHLPEVFTLDDRDREKTLDSLQRIADIIAHVMQERTQFQTTLLNIAELARI